MIFLEYPKCTTCKKAKKWLDDHGVAYEDRNIKEQNPTAEELKAWHDQSGQPLRKFFNTSGMLYREYELKDKLPNMTEEEMLQGEAVGGDAGLIPTDTAPDTKARPGRDALLLLPPTQADRGRRKCPQNVQ